MRLAEFGSCKITEAGKALLKYGDEIELPYREGADIFLPSDALGEMIRLKHDWSQFLFKNRDGVWFGGTDENPFLVRMNREVFDAALVYGIDGFYSSIVPRVFAELVPLLPNHQHKLRRQGDIFCLSISYSPWTIIKAGKLVFGDSTYARDKYVLRGATDHPVFGTRHELSGEGLQGIKLLGVDLPMVARGVIKAPDHSPLELPRLSVLAQTEQLYEPKMAD